MKELQDTWIWSLGREDLLEKEMATHSSILSWKIPWIEEPGRLQSMESQRVGHQWAHTHIRYDTSRLRVTRRKIKGRAKGILHPQQLLSLCLEDDGWMDGSLSLHTSHSPLPQNHLVIYGWNKRANLIFIYILFLFLVSLVTVNWIQRTNISAEKEKKMASYTQ